jgi:hypothetical protein
MPGVKGKFITLTGMLMSNSEEQLAKANQYLESEIGLTHLELDPEDFYDTSLFNEFMKVYIETSGLGKEGYVVVGRRVYPTIKRTAGLPPNLTTPLDFVKFEAEGFLANHTSDVVHRKFLKTEDKNVVVYAPAPGYDGTLYVGVYLGILDICGITTGKVDLVDKDTYQITW